MDLARTIEHTALSAEVTPADVETLCEVASRYGLFGVCIAPRYVSLARQCLEQTPVRIVTVVSFPLGADTPASKAHAALEAVEAGAHEVDVVGPIGMALSGSFGSVESEVRSIRRAVPQTVLKIILETGYFDEGPLRDFARAAIAGGADFLKTSTGMGPRGASIGDVRLLYEVAKGQAEVKASGGIRTASAARALLEAGALRIGTSVGPALLKECR
jgi:deoxyribose-phosphate aldolase